MKKGFIFDIKEFAVQDGPGIRTTVFLKGCPLRCLWCHNPEGLNSKVQLMVKEKNCVGCGKCMTSCEHPDCAGLGRCLHVCPSDLVKAVGRYIAPTELETILRKNREIMNRTGGGVTFSGGEPLLQHEFLTEMLDRLSDIHTIVETSGYADADVFSAVAQRCDEIYLDMKHLDDETHRACTGVSNAPIQKNLDYLMETGLPFTLRVPLIPGINDSREHLERIAHRVSGASGLKRVEFLPYNSLAPAKYASVGMEYRYSAPEGRQIIQIPEEAFRLAGVQFAVMAKV